MNPRTTNMLLLSAVLLTVLGTGVQIYQKRTHDAPWGVTAALLLAFLIICCAAVIKRDNMTLARVSLLLCTLLIMSIMVFNSTGRGGDAFVLFFVLASCAALFLPIREAILWLVFFIAVQAGIIVYYIGMSGILAWISSIGGFFMFGGFGYLVRQANLSREKTEGLYAELQQAHAQLQAYTAQSQQLAVAEERNRLAREMHDSLGHRLTVAVLQLEGAQQLIESEPQRAATMVGNMRDQLKEALSELRGALSGLRTNDGKRASASPHESEITRFGDGPLIDSALVDGTLVDGSLVNDISQMIATFEEATGLNIHVTLPADLPELLPAQRLALFRATQELLTNIQRHAMATESWVDLIHSADAITLTISDNGQGMPDQIDDARFGLRGLRERANQLDGSFRTTARPDGGTIAELNLPLELEPEQKSVNPADLAVEGFHV